MTNLGTRGPGSLQAACNAEGPRIVVFDVSGVIPGNVVIEHGRTIFHDEEGGFEKIRTRKFGQTFLTYYRYKKKN